MAPVIASRVVGVLREDEPHARAVGAFPGPWGCSGSQTTGRNPPESAARAGWEDRRHVARRVAHQHRSFTFMVSRVVGVLLDVGEDVMDDGAVAGSDLGGLHPVSSVNPVETRNRW